MNGKFIDIELIRRLTKTDKYQNYWSNYAYGVDRGRGKDRTADVAPKKIILFEEENERKV